MTTAPGWYPDPQNSGAEIYWDGSRWMRWRPRNSPAGGWYQDPNDPSFEMHWDGHHWTGHRRPATLVADTPSQHPVPPSRAWDAHSSYPASAPASAPPPSPYWPQGPSAFAGRSPATRSGLGSGVRVVGIAVIGTIALVVFVSLFHERILVSDDFRRCVQLESNTYAERMFGVEPRGFALNEIEDKCADEVGKYIWS